MGVISFAVKGGLLYGAVAVTRQQGVWGDSEQTAKVYEKLQYEMNPVCKAVKSSLPFEAPPLPKTGEVRFLTNYYYNEGVKSTIHFIKMIPCYAGQGIKKISDSVKGALDAPPTPAAEKK